MTFTNKAAGRCASASRRSSATTRSGVWLSTFHALCARLLRREAPKIGLSRDFVIYDSSDQVAVVKQIEKELGIDDKLVPPRQALSRISHRATAWKGPRRCAAPRTSATSRSPRSTSATSPRSRDANALDFDDLLLKTVELFETSEQAREFYARKFRYVMVDEYQDTNRPQYLLIRRLAEIHRNLAVVGDPDQSIYKWRGADLRNILDFEHDFPEARDRPPRAELPLDAGHSRRRHRRHQPEPQPQGQAAVDRPAGRLDDRRTTAATTSSRKPTSSSARSSRRAPRTSTATIAVLYRTNAQSRAIEDSLMRESIPYKIIGGVRFYERKEIKDALAYLKLIINPHDDVSLRRVINVPARGIGKGVMDCAAGDRSRSRARRRAAAPRRRPAGGHRRRGRSGPSSSTRSRTASCRHARWRRCASSAT